MSNSGDRVMDHSAVASHADDLAMVSVDATLTGTDDRHCNTSSDSASLCGGCHYCAHCFACLPDLHVMNGSDKTIANFPLTISRSYLDLPTKDRPPRNA